MTLTHWYVPSLVTSIFFLLGMITLYWTLADKAIRYFEKRGKKFDQEQVRTVVGLLYMALFVLSLQLIVSQQTTTWVFMNFQLFAVVFVSYFLLLGIRLWQWVITAVLFMLINGTITQTLSWLYTVIFVAFFFVMKLLKRHRHYDNWDFWKYIIVAMLFSTALWTVVAFRLHLTQNLVLQELLYMAIMLVTVYFYVNLLYRDAATLAQLTYNTNFDELTHAKNFFAFRSKYSQAFDHNRAEQRPFTVMLFDIDHFKAINDTYGHLAGDYVLERLALLIEKYLNSVDNNLVLYRTGGEEFTILFNDYELPDAVKHAEKIANMIRNADFQYDTQTIHISISIGMTQQHADDEDSTNLYKRADGYLYHSKNNGRDQITAK
ncbi:GGDEF domain-containing protein [Lactiplantibacillus dongliensis]|uniref:GGDEF domain-containing protein n=1 Tax=Lactiplantibacillus dongliensis TaxID=2559919 RepID=A0ABW1RAF4_9LACO|nr:GGDEF domain-containing protein [Lactiplantibacillus dongliensis]